MAQVFWGKTRTHREEYIPAQDGAVLFIHGILESPNQFHDFIERIEGKRAVCNLLLPGHGENGAAFAKSGMERWRAHVFGAMRRLAARYGRVLLVGHSMGALLALEAAAAFPKATKGLFLIAVPLVIRLRYSGALNGLRVAFNRVEASDAFGQAAKAAYSIDCSNESPLIYLRWLPRYLELFALARHVRETVRLVRAPVIVFQSEGDELVSMRSLRYFGGMPNVRLHVLRRSGHFYYTPGERLRMLRAFTAFLDHAEKSVTAKPHSR